MGKYISYLSFLLNKAPDMTRVTLIEWEDDYNGLILSLATDDHANTNTEAIATSDSILKVSVEYLRCLYGEHG